MNNDQPRRPELPPPALFFGGGLRRNHRPCVCASARFTAALIEAATSGSPKFFLGTDSAPHTRRAKEAACGCAGIYTAHAALELYLKAFEQAGALDRIEAFASLHGADFYRLPRNHDTVTLVKRPCPVPSEIDLGDDTLVPFRAGDQVTWGFPDDC